MAKKSRYAPMPGSHFNAEQAKVIGKELDRINRQKGCIKPEVVVSEARPKGSPIHDHFTWDDAVAAEQYRIDEARNLIRSVRVIRDPEIPASEQRVIRAFVNVRATDTESRFDGQAYIPITVAARSDDYRQQILNAAKAELCSWQRKYADLKQELSVVFEAIEEVVEA